MSSADETGNGGGWAQSGDESGEEGAGVLALFNRRDEGGADDRAVGVPSEGRLGSPDWAFELGTVASMIPAINSPGHRAGCMAIKPKRRSRSIRVTQEPPRNLPRERLPQENIRRACAREGLFYSFPALPPEISAVSRKCPISQQVLRRSADRTEPALEQIRECSGGEYGVSPGGHNPLAPGHSRRLLIHLGPATYLGVARALPRIGALRTESS